MFASEKIVSDMVHRILAVGQPQRIVLFGSRVRGTHGSGSDYDLLIIQPSEEPRYRRAAPFYRALAGLSAEVDVVVYTPEEVADWSAVREAFVTSAIREGLVLYEGHG